MNPIRVAIDATEYCRNILYFDFSKVCLERTEWASWVQAVGALIAIVFTAVQILLSRSDAKKNAKEKKQVAGAAISDLETRYSQIISSMKWQIQSVQQISEKMKSDPTLFAMIEIQELTRGIQLQYLPDSESVLKVLAMLKTMGEVRKLYTGTAALIKDKTDRLNPIAYERFKTQMEKYIAVAAKVPGVVDNI